MIGRTTDNGPWPRDRGFTLVEALVSAVLLVGILGVTYAVLHTGEGTYSVGMTKSDVDRSAKRVLERIAEEISMSGADVMHPVPVPPYATSTLTFQRNTGYCESGIIWGPTTRIAFRQAPDDPADGVDNNSNGMIDEGMVVLTENLDTPDESQVVLCRGVARYLEGEQKNNVDDNGNGLKDEAGFALEARSGVWTIHLTLQRRNSRGDMETATVQTSVTPRN